MSTSARILTAVAAMFLFAIGGVSMAAADDDTRSDTAVSNAALPQARLQVLPNNGKAGDVYLQSLDIRVEVMGNIASTRHTMVFKNKAKKELEGVLTFPLPAGRCVTYYALDFNDTLREAVVVEKATAARAFFQMEDWPVNSAPVASAEADGNFRVSVYPIPAGGIRTVSIGYEEELAFEKGMLHYRMPMAYPDSLKAFSVKAMVYKSDQKPIVPESAEKLLFDKAGEDYAASFVRKKYRPARPLVFAMPAPTDNPSVVTQPADGSRYFLASVAPNLETRKKQWGSELAIIWDVSLSASQRDLRREMEMLDIIFSQKKNADVYLYFLNNKFKNIADKNAVGGAYKVINGKWNGLKKTLEAAAFDGGTDFSEINLNTVRGNEILFFSDGVSTLSDADFLQSAKINRPIHSVVSSASADCGAMKLIAGRTRGKYLSINDLSFEKLKDELLNETPQFLGAEYGKALRDVHPGIATPVYGNFSVAGIVDKDSAELTLLFGYGNDVKKRIKVRLDAKPAKHRYNDNDNNVYKIWAQKKIAELELEYEKNGGELTKIGMQFGLVTRNTSLVVLDGIYPYIQYGITPPDGLKTGEYYKELYEKQQRDKAARLNNKKRLRDENRNMLKAAVKAAKNTKEWWDTEFKPHKPEYPTPDVWLLSGRGGGYSVSCFRGHTSCGPYYKRAGGVAEMIEWKKIPPSFMTKPIREDNDYLDKLTGKTVSDYQIYLKLRDDYVSSPAFYFDMANWFYAHGDKGTAIRILTSVADLELENASLYRSLGYRFKEFGEYGIEKFVCGKVIKRRPMEPQGYRDYALALADNGETQAALDSLYSILKKPYGKSILEFNDGIEELIVTEINRLIAKHPRLNTSRIDKRLIIDIPVDIRVVINWNNMDSTNVSPDVKDPNNQRCNHYNKETSIGGRMSGYTPTENIDRAYGPQQFLLKKAVKGKYQIYVDDHCGSRFTAAGPTTVMAEIYTKYAGKTEQRKVVCLQLNAEKTYYEGKDGTIHTSAYEDKLVAEIEF